MIIGPSADRIEIDGWIAVFHEHGAIGTRPRHIAVGVKRQGSVDVFFVGFFHIVDDFRSIVFVSNGKSPANTDLFEIQDELDFVGRYHRMGGQIQTACQTGLFAVERQENDTALRFDLEGVCA